MTDSAPSPIELSRRAELARECLENPRAWETMIAVPTPHDPHGAFKTVHAVHYFASLVIELGARVALLEKLLRKAPANPRVTAIPWFDAVEAALRSAAASEAGKDTNAS